MYAFGSRQNDGQFIDSTRRIDERENGGQKIRTHTCRNDVIKIVIKPVIHIHLECRYVNQVKSDNNIYISIIFLRNYSIQ